MIEKLAYTLYKLENYDSATIEYINENGGASSIVQDSGVLVIEMINLFTIEIPPAMIEDEEWIKKFDHVIVNNVYEGPIKLVDHHLLAAQNQQPVYEFLMSFYTKFKPTSLTYVDNDIDTDRSFLQWCKYMKIKKPPFTAQYFPNIHFSNLLLQSIGKDYDATDIKDFFTSRWNEILPTKLLRLYWSFNRHKRLGRVFIFYMLYKAGLLNKGLVSMHVSHLNSRLIHLGKQIGITIDYSDLEEINKQLPMSVDSGVIVSKDPNDLPKMRNDAILSAAINVCTETHFFENNLFFTEKTLKPILFRQVILPVASHGLYHRITELYNFKFSKITYEIDNIADPLKRLTAVIDALTHFSVSTPDLENELIEVDTNWKHNMKILVDHCDETQHSIIMRMINENITNRI